MGCLWVGCWPVSVCPCQHPILENCIKGQSLYTCRFVSAAYTWVHEKKAIDISDEGSGSVFSCTESGCGQANGDGRGRERDVLPDDETI